MRRFVAGLAILAAGMLGAGTAGAQTGTATWGASAGCGAANVSGGILSVAGGTDCNAGFTIPFTVAGDPSAIWFGTFSFQSYVTGPDGLGPIGWELFAGGSCDQLGNTSGAWSTITAYCGASYAGSVRGESAEVLGLPAGSTLYIRGPAFIDSPVAAPEPTSLALLATGLLGLVPFARRRHT